MFDYSDGYKAFDPGNLFGYALIILLIVAHWFTFLKAGRHGWAAIVPFYNLYTLVKVANRPGWWLILLLIPLVNIVFSIIVALDISRLFGKGGAFGFFLLWLLPYIGYPIIAWGDAYYRGTKPGAPTGPGAVTI